jgi:hypothetical protein
MRRDEETLLRDAVQALQSAEPEAAQVTTSAMRVAARLGIEGMNEMKIEAIENCDDVRRLLNSYRAGSLPEARSLLIEAHLRDCGACRQQFKSGGSNTVNWFQPRPTRAVAVRPRAFGWAIASALALMACSLFIYRAFWQIPPGVRAEVQSIDGSAYRISDAGEQRLSAGATLAEGDRLRLSGGAHAMLRLADGSMIEANERSVLGVSARGRSMTVSIENGAVIVQAAKRSSGHLYVKTPDCRVAVTGTIFSVNAGIKGSRVAVLQGTVHVAYAGNDSVVQAGDQLATNDNLSPEPVASQIAWSQDRAKYLPLLAQLAALQRRIENIPFPHLRYSSDLLERVPSNTLLYVSIPNLGEFLSEANQIFHDQLQQSPELQQWWNSGKHHNTADLDSMVDKLHRMSQYLGEEVVVVGFKQGNNPSFAIVADLKQSGLDTFLKTQLPTSNASAGVTVLNEDELSSAVASSNGSGGFVLIREHEVVVSNNIATLRQMNAQLNSGNSGFATGDFGKQIESAYTRGAGVILAADLHRMMHEGTGNRNATAALENSGIGNVEYLIAEHREANGMPENHLNVQFAGARQRIASWLAAPAPIGSLNFVTPNAAIAVAGLSKDPKEIAEDILAIAGEGKAEQVEKLNEVEQKLQVSLRDDLAATLGGDFLIALDGPVLPTPSWKVVIEVNDSQRLEQTLERLTTAIHNQDRSTKAHVIAIESTQAGDHTFYTVHDQTTGLTPVHYTFAEGYMILAPNRALLMEAIHTHATGNSLAHSDAFKALLPKDENENYSAVAYQNLSPILTPLLTQLSGKQAEALNSLAADAKPTAICAWGKESRIEVASNSRLFGFDFLSLQALINSRNRHSLASVHE